MSSAVVIVDKELEFLLTLLLEKTGIARGLSKDAQHDLVKKTAQNLSEAGIEVKKSDILDPDRKLMKKLITALAATLAMKCGEEVGKPFEFDFKTLNDDAQLSPDEKEKMKKQLDSIKFELTVEPEPEHSNSPTPAPGAPAPHPDEPKLGMEGLFDGNGVFILPFGTFKQGGSGMISVTSFFDGDVGAAYDLIKHEVLGPTADLIQEHGLQSASPRLVR